MTVYLLWHVRADDPDSDDAKLIGAYSTAERAQAAIARLADQPGFAKHPEGFQIDPYEIDKDHWSEGFISWAEA